MNALNPYYLRLFNPELLDKFREHLRNADPMERKHRLKASVIRLIRIGAIRVVNEKAPIAEGLVKNN